MPVDKKLLAILVCPICKGELTYEKVNEELICHAEKLAFPIQDGIPIMLESEARPFETDEAS
jgi:uncharacterized protein YbaR (Trm112 family)